MSAKKTVFAVKLTPRGRRDTIDGWTKDADGEKILKVRVTAPPVDGKANAALIAVLAEALGVSKSHFRIAGGETARNKRVEVEGDAEALARRLAALGDVE